MAIFVSPLYYWFLIIRTACGIAVNHNYVIYSKNIRGLFNI